LSMRAVHLKKVLSSLKAESFVMVLC